MKSDIQKILEIECFGLSDFCQFSCAQGEDLAYWTCKLYCDVIKTESPNAIILQVWISRDLHSPEVQILL